MFERSVKLRAEMGAALSGSTTAGERVRFLRCVAWWWWWWCRRRDGEVPGEAERWRRGSSRLSSASPRRERCGRCVVSRDVMIWAVVVFNCRNRERKRKKLRGNRVDGGRQLEAYLNTSITRMH